MNRDIFYSLVASLRNTYKEHHLSVCMSHLEYLLHIVTFPAENWQHFLHLHQLGSHIKKMAPRLFKNSWLVSETKENWLNYWGKLPLVVLTTGPMSKSMWLAVQIYRYHDVLISCYPQIPFINKRIISMFVPEWCTALWTNFCHSPKCYCCSNNTHMPTISLCSLQGEFPTFIWFG